MSAPLPAPSALTLPLRTARPTTRPPVRSPDIRPRFTPAGSDALEDHLDRTCARIAAGVRGLIPREQLDAILLGGGYGRGEGGVLKSPAGDRPYNDLEFYVFVRGNRHLNQRRFGHALHVLGEILTPQAGVEVEFKIESLAEFSAAPVSMFSYDLVTGHHRLFGSESVLDGCAAHREAESIPLCEATRLLMNRCSGLLFARERLERKTFTPADADFVRRNLAKAELAFGDAVLAALGRYHWSVRERHRRIEHLARCEHMPWIEEVRRHHALGTVFKLHPERSTDPRELLHELHGPISALAERIFLWIEGKRLGEWFSSARDYAESTANKWPDGAGARNALVNLKVFGRRAPFRRLWQHPRHHVLHALARLLWCPDPLGDPATRRLLERELQAAPRHFAGAVAEYQRLWSMLN